MFHFSKLLIYATALSLSLLFVPAAIAGPPLLCHPFDTAGAPSLAWSGPGWRDAKDDYDLAGLVADTERLLAPRTPVIARMEILRRATLYSAHNGTVARELMTRLQTRIAQASTPDAQALALFDAGYYAETVQELVRFIGYGMRDIGRVDLPALREILAKGDGSRRIAQAMALRPDDASMRFAAALVASADQRKDDYAKYARIARAGASNDRLLALNVNQIAR